MSANYEKQSGFFYLPVGKVDPMMDAMLVMMFDEQVDLEIDEIKKEKQEFDLYFRLSLIKTFLFPAEWLLTLVFMGKKYTKEKVVFQRLYWKFITGKVKIREFKEEVVKLANQLVENNVKF